MTQIPNIRLGEEKFADGTRISLLERSSSKQTIQSVFGNSIDSIPPPNFHGSIDTFMFDDRVSLNLLRWVLLATGALNAKGAWKGEGING